VLSNASSGTGRMRSRGFARGTDGLFTLTRMSCNISIHTGRYYKATINDDCRIIGLKAAV
jgi:hypothetical protein